VSASEQKIKKQQTIQGWLDKATLKLHSALNQNLETEREAKSEARILLTHAFDKPPSYLRTWPELELDEQVMHKAEQLLECRLTGEPIAYILGYREFWSLVFKVSPNVLIPRAETELLVELCIEYLGNLDQQSTVVKLLELGTGSGAISVAVAHEMPEIEITATDISNLALDLARDNAASHQCDKIEFKQCSWYEGITANNYDMIVSNPPYIDQNDEHLTRGDLPYEPTIALSSGDSGLKDIGLIIASATDYLKIGGRLALEHGYDQANSIQKLMLEAGFEKVKTIKDHAGIARITTGIKR